MAANLLLIPGDGVGPEIMAQARLVLDELCNLTDLDVNCEYSDLGGAAYDKTGHALPPGTLSLAKDSDAVLFGAAGGPQWDSLPRENRPETALLRLRRELDLFANLRPAILFDCLASSSSLKADLVSGLDILIIRELTGGIYFGEPRGVETLDCGKRRGVNTLVYHEDEISRIAHVAFKIARQRDNRVCSIDKANVLETTELWRQIVTDVGGNHYPDVELSHMLVDNAAMQLVREPKQFDVIVTTNMFGDILSDVSAMLTGSIGMLPSASLDRNQKGLFEPVHGTAPDIAGQDKVNPLAMILSLAMLLRYTLKQDDLADKVEQAVENVIDNGLRTHDIFVEGAVLAGTGQMGSEVVSELRNLLN
ncbi:MAG: 3-isopropylmalate dehydrogenase [Acidiferrobacterales bacterium]|nr:3-isopropylmalate dehydrogenase [Acidiferrobacterales bacterium]